MLYRTKGNANPKGKPRVYFTCHPDDFDRYFDKLCEDIFKTHDCAIYYTEDMTEVILEEDKETDLGQMNLFIVPVTFKLMTEPCRAMLDITYAKERLIPILPFMMETGIDSIYALLQNFGERQYLSPYSHDLTEVSYEDKLKKYLDAVLISDELAGRVREAFDAYVFLSYRKKDRRYANELMRLIHTIPEYRDIEIWYDEFLTPGESFRENIERALKNSKLFTLLVTPSLLEMVDGKPNFVMDKEYPAAVKAELPVLPAEMEGTDPDELQAKYKGLPPCVDPKDEAAFNACLAEALVNLAIRENNDDPVHNFLIGIAYLEGIDVEVDNVRGVELITSSAEAGFLEAMQKLFEMYMEGKGVALNYRKAAYWGERIYEYCKAHDGEEHPDTLLSLSNLAFAYGDLGDYEKALEMNKKAYALRCQVLGEEHPGTLLSLSNLASAYGDLGDYEKALDMN